MIYLTGDTHIPIDISKLNTSNFPEQKQLTRDDYLIVLGDFGLYWHNDKEYEHWRKWLQEKSFTILWLDGNHENFDWINSMDISEWHGGKVHADGNIIHLMRGNYYEIKDKHFFVAGGAQSYDKAHRKENIDWWSDELWSHSQMEYAFSMLEGLRITNTKIDYVLSHTCPQELIKPMFNIDVAESYEDSTTKLLSAIRNDIPNEDYEWYFGHWHVDRDFGKFHCLYDNIVKLD